MKTSTQNNQLQTTLETLFAEIWAANNNQMPYTIGKTVTPDHIRKHLSRYTFNYPIELETLLEDVMQMMREWNLQVTHARYLGLYNPAPMLASVVAETLVALYNPQLAAWSHAPAANEIERHTLHFIGNKLGFAPATSASNFTAGGSEANHTAMLAALAFHFPEYLNNGLVGLRSQPVFYVSEYAHNSFDKICKHAGIGLYAMRIIATNDQLQLNTQVLQTQIEQDRKNGCTPFMVVGTAGTTSTGVIDPLDEIAQICSSENIWFHVDAAWAGAIALSDKLRPLLKGIEKADSVTVDAHKWLFVSFGAGMFFCKHRDVIVGTFSVRADYMPKSNEDTTDPYTSTIQWTRRCMGLKLFMTMAHMGEEGISQTIEYQASIGDYLKQQLISKGWIIVNHTPLPVVCFTHPRIQQGLISVDEMLQTIYKEGNLWISAITLKNKQKAFRACITNHKTTFQDIDFIINQLETIIHNIHQ